MTQYFEVFPVCVDIVVRVKMQTVVELSLLCTWMGRLSMCKRYEVLLRHTKTIADADRQMLSGTASTIALDSRSRIIALNLCGASCGAEGRSVGA